MGQIIIEKKVYRFNHADLAKRLGINRITIWRALSQGETHPQFKLCKLLSNDRKFRNYLYLGSVA